MEIFDKNLLSETKVLKNRVTDSVYSCFSFV